MKSHRYAYAASLDNSNTAAYWVVKLTGTQKRVLELGSGPGSITRLLQQHAQCRVTAIEIEEESVRLVTPFCERVLQCDLNSDDWKSRVNAGPGYDVVIAADVLEHLQDPVQTLRQMAGVLRPGGHVVVSLPNAGHNAVLTALASGRVRYGNSGLLDRTHIRFFGVHDMQALFDAAGLRIQEAKFVGIPPDLTELASIWKETPARLRRALGENRHGGFYQVVVQAFIASDTGPKLQLAELLPPKPQGTFPQQIKGTLRRWIKE